MNEEQARQTAGALGGETWQSGGGIWVVLVRRDDGAVIVITDEVVCEYASEEAFGEGEVVKCVMLV